MHNVFLLHRPEEAKQALGEAWQERFSKTAYKLSWISLAEETVQDDLKHLETSHPPHLMVILGSGQNPFNQDVCRNLTKSSALEDIPVLFLDLDPEEACS